MSKDYENSTFKELLDKLQQESWQLQLLISGFAIFGLFSATEPIGIKLEITEHSQYLAETLIWFAAKICCWILISNLLIQGFLKRKKWTTFFYFPIYRIFSIITLSFLYRLLVYNLLDNKFGKRLRFVLVPVYVFILYLFTHSYIDSNYIKVDRNSSTYYANPGNYENLIVEENDFINVATIPSKVITDSYMKVFMIFNENVEERLFSFNPGLKPKEDRRGLKSEIVFFGDFDREEFRKRDSLRLVYYKTFNDVHKISINGKKQETTFITSTTKNKKLGFETYINIDTLKEGKHLLKISRKYINKKKDTVRNILVSIPFWKFNTDK